MTDTIPILDILAEATLQSSILVKDYFKQHLTPQYKSSSHDLVTKADIESQSRIQEVIRKKLIEEGIAENEIGFLGEENALHVKGKYIFAIDPIDGTTNFASGIEYFVISVACFIDGELSYGFLREPLTDRVYFCQKGQGAFKKNSDNKTKLTIDPIDLKEAMVATYIHSEESLRAKQLEFIKRIYPQIRGMRILGAGALDLVKVADNVFQVAVFYKSYIWDIAAATLIIEEAGGEVVDLDGEKIVFDLDNPNKIYPVLACHPSNLVAILQLL
jgi:myo-inositol-1(or 4)-monophosphatase